MQIDLNADLGENTPGRVVSDDAAMLQLVSSANVACGFHAGDPFGIKTTLAAAATAGVRVGAHPGYDDFAAFGRREVDVPPAVLQAQLEYQLGALGALAATAGTSIRYVKPHGALYNRMARDRAHARIVADAVRAINPALPVLCLAGSAGAQAVRERGLTVACEAFADRGYAPDGALLPRGTAGAILHDAAAVAERVVRLAHEGVIAAADGSLLRVDAQSVCLHGDTPDAVALASAVRQALAAAGIAVSAFTDR